MQTLAIKIRPRQLFILQHKNIEVRIWSGGVGGEEAEKAAELLTKTTCNFFFLSGFCGGLNFNLNPGELLWEVFPSNPWREVFQKIWPPCKQANLPIFTSSVTLARTPKEKMQIAASTHAQAVEMESAAVKKICASKRIPLIHLRTVSDLAQHKLPLAVTQLKADGTIPLRFWGALLRYPEEWLDFVKLVRTTRQAERNLKKAWAAFWQNPESCVHPIK